jgi:hypothetical protein
MKVGAQTCFPQHRGFSSYPKMQRYLRAKVPSTRRTNPDKKKET